MTTRIEQYLMEACRQKHEAAAKIALPFSRHGDIRAELEQWIERKTYPKKNPLSVEGYTAEAISDLAPFMDGVGVYNFMITLRERPDYAKCIIAKGFQRK